MPYYENRAGERLWYEDAGAGEAVVFIHGWCMAASVWEYQLKGLESFFRVVAPDLRGHGRSRSVSGRLDFESFAADLSDLLASLGLSRIILVGWSMGAQIALQAYREISERLAGLVLVSATPCFTASPDFPYGLARNETAGMKIKVGRNTQRALQGFHARMFAEEELESCPVDGRIRTLLTSIEPPNTISTLAALESLAMADMRDLLPGISAPTLIMNGECDKICLPQASKYLADNIRSARRKVYPRCGHAPFLTRHAEFNADIARFAEGVSAINA